VKQLLPEIIPLTGIDAVSVESVTERVAPILVAGDAAEPISRDG
jgi:hypothetical protein